MQRISHKQTGNAIILRCPIIPASNDRNDHREGIAEVASSLTNLIEINLLPYHPLGLQKVEDLGLKGTPGLGKCADRSTIEKIGHRLESLSRKPVRIMGC